MKHQEIEESKKNFLYNIKWLRGHYGLSKQKMAKLLGIGVSSLNKLEQGILPPGLSASILFFIQKNFGVHPRQIFEKINENEAPLHADLKHTT